MRRLSQMCPLHRFFCPRALIQAQKNEELGLKQDISKEGNSEGWRFCPGHFLWHLPASSGLSSLGTEEDGKAHWQSNEDTGLKGGGRFAEGLSQRRESVWEQEAKREVRFS